MADRAPTIPQLLRSAVALGNQLLDAANSAVLQEHADYCQNVAREIWRFACSLRGEIPASDRERATLNELCAALGSRLEQR
jgi:hypothetical protein